MGRWVALFLAAAFAQVDDDPMAKLKAPQALAKAREAWTKKKGAHIRLEMTSSLLASELRGIEQASFAGKLVKDFASLLGDAEIYSRGTEKLIRQDKEFVEPRRATGKSNRIVSLARNPAVVAAELFRFAGGASYGADEKVGDVDCRIVETAADERSVIEQIKEVSGTLKSLEQYYIKDFTSITDRKQSTSLYKAWMSRTTLLPARLEWTLTIVVNKKAIPFGGDQVPDQFEAKYVYTFPKYDTDLEIQVPPQVRQKLGGP